MDKHALLEQIKADIIKKHICPDLAETATHLVMGDGNPDADIVFIGEAPGKKEDIQGTPFVGAAGKFLDELLARIDLRRSDIYITNIVKYRPPDNRDPRPAEKAAFWPYLLQELMVIDPTVIVTLGRHSMGYFLPDATIGAVHGQPQTINVALPSGDGQVTWTLLPLYHPAAALYNGRLRQTLTDDFTQLIQLMK